VALGRRLFFSEGNLTGENTSETGTRTKDKEKTERTGKRRGEGQDTRRQAGEVERQRLKGNSPVWAAG